MNELQGLRARVAALEASSTPAVPTSHHRVRSFFSALLIVIGCVLAPLSAVAVWAADEVGDTGRYVDTVAPLASDADVQSAVANRVTNAVMAHIDLNSLLEGVAPADRPRLAKALGKLGGSLESALRSFVQDKAEAVVASDGFKTIWIDANRKAHAAVDKALTGSGGGAVELTDDSVQIDLGPVVDQVKQRLVADGLTVAGKIPEVHTEITIFRSDDIGKVKTGFRLLQLAGYWLPVLALLLVVVGVLLAVRRRRALVAAALGVAFALAVLGVALTAFRSVYLDALPLEVSQPAAESVYDALTRYLRASVRMVIALGIVVALAAWLTGRGRWALLVRQLWQTGIGAVRGAADRAGMRTGPVGPWVRRYRRWITWLLVAGAVVAYLLWSYPTGWVVVGLALALLLALAVVEFLAGEPVAAVGGQPGPSHPGSGTGSTAGSDSGSGTGRTASSGGVSGRGTPPAPEGSASPERPNSNGGGTGAG
ncbi:hypothetical protein [Streptomyces albipurpureus]|uniref:Integral membrane protein n=1 Tax=Streptomyces albipurpureus TaxID=2897419 RepID=A0ABT0UNZ6_9ACTN|nr:hypothetical protein [Streptomyces sp. CWNU-1]MCM2388976.1 hypothetical protein [Streptomyces sp. CWNU-1]